MARLVLGTMTIGPAVGDAHSDGTHTNMMSCTLPHYSFHRPADRWLSLQRRGTGCQTPPDVAAAQLRALVDAAHAAAGPGAPEEGKFLVDTASAVLPLCP